MLTSVYGVFCRADAAGHMEKLLKDSEFDPTYSQIANSRRDPSFRRNHAALSLSPNDVVYGLGRMFGMLRENQGEKGIRVFRGLDEALDWVFFKNTSA